MASDELQAIIDALRSRPIAGDFAERRRNMEQLAATAPPLAGLTAEPVDAGGVPAEWVSMPGADPQRMLLYTHGGGYTTGSLNTHRRFVGLLSAAAGVRVLNLDYRLAPEHPHPAAVEDATAAYRWLLAHGADPAKVVLGGDSAGGGLAAATLVALRDAGDPLPAGAVLISPWTDLTLTSETMTTRAEVDPMCSAETLKSSADAYLGGAEPKQPTISPRFADLDGLPPLLVHVGDAEVLLDDSTGLAAAALEAGVDVTLWVAPEMIHVWHVFSGLLPESDVAIAKVADWLRVTLA
jgi:acetyl esterase/lipase